MNNFIFLMGMPGCGKSTWGKKLAQKINFRFLDLDEFIELKTGLSIAELFSDKGEVFFREIETTYLNEIIASEKNLVVSLGGGTPCFNNNLKTIKANGKTIFLDAPVKLLADRIINAVTIRPMFKNLGREEIIDKLEDLFLKRYPYYKEADITHQVKVLKLNHLLLSLENK